MNLSDFDYNLPKELIAQYPSKNRDESRLLVLRKDTGKIEHRVFKDIIEYLHEWDLLVLNNTKVIPAKLTGRKETGGRVEALILFKGMVESEYEALLNPARGCVVGKKIIFANGAAEAEITAVKNGRRFLKFNSNGSMERLLEKIGEVPLPPYIKRKECHIDRERYQTIYASRDGAIAAPTAGLHFTTDILNALSKRGIDIDYVTLHVGYGTFSPVKCEDIRNHRMEREYFEIDKDVVENGRNKKGRVIAVGTTSCRVLETVFSVPSPFTLNPPPTFGWTDLFIYPPYKFRIVDALITNFHLPKTSLLMLVSAFCGRDLLFKAYREAIKEGYRFYSYGDAMLIL